MRSSFFGLEIGRTGLTTAQFGLDVTGHNIANLDTDGYTRQRIVSTAYDPFSTVGRFAPVGQGLVGGGVRVQILDQIRSAFLDRRFRSESTAHAYWDTRAQSLSYIESFFDNVNEKTSINYSMAQFFESMSVLAKDPVSGAPRTLMQTTAMDLVQQLNMIYQGLVDFQTVENKAVETKVGDINRIARDIRDLNVAIYTFEITGMIANDLRDKRNLMIDELSRYIDIECEEYPDPLSKDMVGIKHDMLRIKVGGEILVDHDYPRPNNPDLLGIAYVDNVLGPDEAKVAVPYWNHIGGVSLNDTNPNFAMIIESAKLNMNPPLVTGGELKAHMDMRDKMGGGVNSADRGVPYYIDMVNNLARALLQEINAQHVQGWSDNPNGTETDIHFFSIKVWNPATQEYDIEDLGLIEYFDKDGNPVPDQDDDDFAYKTYTLSNADLQRITAKNLTLSQEIQDSAYNIAASSKPIGRPLADGTSGDPEELQRHNNINMKAMYDLFRKTGITVFDDAAGFPRRDIGSFDDYGTTIRFDVGKTLHTAKQTAETSRILTLAANNQRTSVAGVSLDEEMVGLVKYNHAYNGAARVITAMDDLLDRLINGTGRVGL